MFDQEKPLQEEELEQAAGGFEVVEDDHKLDVTDSTKMPTKGPFGGGSRPERSRQG